MSHRSAATIPILLSLAGMIISIVLLLQHHNQTHDLALVSMLCGGEGPGGCAGVSRSTYGSLFGLPLAGYGVMFYGSLTLLLLLASLSEMTVRDAALRVAALSTMAALMIDVILLCIQAFVLSTFCNLCISTYFITALILWRLWKYRRKPAREGTVRAFAQPGGKLFVVATGVGILVLVVAVIAGNAALLYQDPTQMEVHLSNQAYDEFLESPVVDIPLSGAPIKGNPDAQLTVVLFSDFLCPWCRQLATSIRQHFPKWEDRVRMAFISYPLDRFCNPTLKTTTHPGSCWAALGGVCAAEQGKFWEYHDQMYQNPPRNASPSIVLNIAAEAGLDTSRMDSCMRLTSMQSNVRSQIRIGSSLAITGTPRVFINGRKLPKLSYFNIILKKEAARLGIGPLEGLDE